MIGRPRLAISVGCPSGIGPEVAATAADALFRTRSKSKARVVLVGDARVIEEAARQRALTTRFVQAKDAAAAFAVDDAIAVVQPSRALRVADVKPGRPSARGGAAQLEWIDVATDLVSRGQADALVTGPVSKEAIARSGAPGSSTFLGHTEHLALRLGAREVVMAFYAEALTTALVTTHLPLAAVPRAIDAKSVARATFWLARLLNALNSRSVRIAVASLNPHAGEGGLLGHEEGRAIAPGIEAARARLQKEHVEAELFGPVPAETAFRRAVAGDYDGVVAMYHDQATIPMKCLSFGDAVNVSLGLPIVRTSVDHGTGYDIAGQGKADPSGMEAAIDLGARLAQSNFTGGPKGGAPSRRSPPPRRAR